MRYLGCKSKLLEQIGSLIEEKGLYNKKYTFFDAFSGTASVGNYFKSKFKIIANDIQFYSFVISNAKLNTPDGLFQSLEVNPFELFNDEYNRFNGFVYHNYSSAGSDRMYFSQENAARIDYIRVKIETWFKGGKITQKEYYYLIACLLEAVSKVANVAGVYGSFLRKWDPRSIKKLKFIPLELEESSSLHENKIYNQKTEEIIDSISGDILYLDPPYTKNQYSVQYHLLETIAKYDNPIISGKGGLRDTGVTSSDFSKKGNAEVAFEYIIAKAKFKHIIVSYSSDGIMSENYIEKILKRYGKENTFEKRKVVYKTYQNHRTKKKENHQEFLFYIEKKSKDLIQYASPLNYQGGKYDIIGFIKQYLPKEPIDQFVDLFGGGYNVGINVEAKQILYNDINDKVVQLIEMFRSLNTAQLVRYIIQKIKKYKLLSNDKEAYQKIRAKYNEVPLKERDVRMLYILILYGFNQQIRFNSSYDYNNPVGQACFNESILEKLITFSRRIKEQNLVITSKSFEDVIPYISKKSFVYCDPPYLVTLGSYNDGKRGFEGWTEEHELKLYEFLDVLDSKDIKFMLSNVLEHNDKKNNILTNWLKEKSYYLYENTTVSRGGRREVLVTNYKAR